MKRIMIIGLALMLTTFSFAQRPDPDKIQTKTGVITVQPVLHGSLVLQWNNKTIYVDPYGGAVAFSGLASPDLILITDIHGDHLNTKTLESLELSNAKLIVPKAVYDQLSDELKEKSTVISNGESSTQFGIEIKAIPMYNLPEAADSRHIKGRGNGYVLKMDDKIVYLSGDTEDIPEMRELKNIDIAFVCMNLPYTMDIDQASSAVLDFKPKIVYPYHYRGQGGLSDVEAFKKQVNEKNKEIEVRLRNWYPEYK